MTRTPDYKNKYPDTEEYHPTDDDKYINTGNGNGTVKKPRQSNLPDSNDNNQDDYYDLEEEDIISLLESDIPPMKEIIPGILYEGTTLFVASPKEGKSLMALDLSVQVVRNGGCVLYLALEDDRGIIQERLQSQLQGETIDRGKMTFAYKAGTLGTKGILIKQLEESLKKRPDIQLIVIDIFGQVKAGRSGSDVYANDRAPINPLRELSHDRHISILLVHHTNKVNRTDDPFNSISGSNGLRGAVDTTWFLKRDYDTGEAMLLVRSRIGLSDGTYKYILDPITGIWKSTGILEENAPEIISRNERAILDVLEELEADEYHPVKAVDISDKISFISKSNIRQIMHRMKRKGIIKSSTFGLYYLVDQKCDKVGQIVTEGYSDTHVTIENANYTTMSQSVTQCHTSVMDEVKLTPDNVTNYPYDIYGYYSARGEKMKRSRCYRNHSRAQYLPFYNKGEWEEVCDMCYSNLTRTKGREC